MNDIPNRRGGCRTLFPTKGQVSPDALSITLSITLNWQSALSFILESGAFPIRHTPFTKTAKGIEPLSLGLQPSDLPFIQAVSKSQGIICKAAQGFEPYFPAYQAGVLPIKLYCQRPEQESNLHALSDTRFPVQPSWP